MPGITPTNQAKNSITPSTSSKSGYVLWGDTHYSWGDVVGHWGDPIISFINTVKNMITPTNTPKS
jgi:hypothetical protein